MKNCTPKTSKTQKRKNAIESGEYPLGIFGRTGQIVGKISGDTTHKDMSAKTAFLKFPYPAIAHTIAALEYMREMGAVYIDVLDTDSGKHYRTTVQKYFDEGEYFYAGEKWGEQLKLALPKLTQTRDPDYMPPTESIAPAYTEATETKPLTYKSRATVGVVWNGKQMSLFGDGE
jgi:hypothetical protein